MPSWIKRLKKRVKNIARDGDDSGGGGGGPVVIPRPEHTISRADISENALKVLYRLKNAGYQAHLVGGGVRDLLLGREPKDFDVATDASPEEVKQVFRNCRLIGRRFRLAHVHFGREIIEVATFRGADRSGDRSAENGMLVRDNVWGTLEEDAQRRDFTVNALYYNIEDFSLIDYHGGMEDLRNGVLRLLGDPETRYREDPVRMLRAVRFAAKLGFRIDPACEAPLFGSAALLRSVPAARLFDEVLKLFMGGTGVQAFEKLRHYGLFGELFPQTEETLARQDHEFPITFVVRGLHNTDLRIREGKPVTPAFLFAVLLWEPVRLRANELIAQGEAPVPAMQQAGSEVIGEQLQRVSIPRRYSLPMREIWGLQHRFEQRNGRRPQRLLGHPRFRAAYDFLLLRAEAGEADGELASWWTDFQQAEAGEQSRMAEPVVRRRPRRRRRRRPRKPAASDG
ncbi:MAG TPA: polynucleotide adenylyltransferase PcnB [Sedimenticola thiotaurini]|uniref:Poly(A) polymerase I n=1 Tax=Sedimenticola thiotaurini TaxID=1543721 RepID=A0A831RMV4_9GAMM|nr:polynucleotide adenylyltransferase PcnB [Sedimenticola thiotaurini]